MHLAEKGRRELNMWTNRHLLLHQFICICVDDILEITHVKIPIDRKKEIEP